MLITVQTFWRKHKGCGMLCLDDTVAFLAYAYMGFSKNYWSSVKTSLCFHCLWFIFWYASFNIFLLTVWIPLANRGWSRLWQRYDITPQSAVWVFTSLHALYSFVFIVLSKHNHAVQVYTPNYLFGFFVRALPSEKPVKIRCTLFSQHAY